MTEQLQMLYSKCFLLLGAFKSSLTVDDKNTLPRIVQNNFSYSLLGEFCLLGRGKALMVNQFTLIKSVLREKSQGNKMNQICNWGQEIRTQKLMTKKEPQSFTGSNSRRANKL